MFQAANQLKKHLISLGSQEQTGEASETMCIHLVVILHHSQVVPPSASPTASGGLRDSATVNPFRLLKDLDFIENECFNDLLLGIGNDVAWFWAIFLQIPSQSKLGSAPNMILRAIRIEDTQKSLELFGAGSADCSWASADQHDQQAEHLSISQHLP